MSGPLIFLVNYVNALRPEKIYPRRWRRRGFKPCCVDRMLCYRPVLIQNREVAKVSFYLFLSVIDMCSTGSLDVTKLAPLSRHH